jgi:hypothetical protein
MMGFSLMIPFDAVERLRVRLQQESAVLLWALPLEVPILGLLGPKEIQQKNHGRCPEE